MEHDDKIMVWLNAVQDRCEQHNVMTSMVAELASEGEAGIRGIALQRPDIILTILTKMCGIMENDIDIYVGLVEGYLKLVDLLDEASNAPK